jgi:cysteine desulfurase/selenocysteine lyase
VLGTINPIKKIAQTIKKNNPNCLVIVDAAQAIPHMKVSVTEWDVDGIAFSSHKMLGPTGVGVLWAKMDLLERLNPYQYGGEMIEAVYLDKTIFKKPPYKFEAGTPHIAGVIGFGAAIDYLSKLGMKNVREHEIELVKYAFEKLKAIKGLKIYGPTNPEIRGGVIAFTLDGVHAHDIAQILDSNNICIRAGHHCTMPLHLYLKIASTARISFYIYTTKGDIDALVEGLKRVKKTFS